MTNAAAGKHGAGRTMRPGRVIGCPIDETTMLIIGLGGIATGEVVVYVDGDRARARHAFVSNWRLAAPSPRAKQGFAALMPTRGTDRALTTIQFGEEGSGASYIFAPRPASAEEAATLVAESAGPQSAAVIDRLVDILMAGNIGRRTLQSITALLRTANASDGFVELVGESHDGATFLQGWSRGMAPGRCLVSVVGAAKPVATECGIAVFPRPDAPDGASGFVGLLDANDATRALDIEGLVFQGRAGWRYAPAHPRKRIAGPLDTPEHIRSILMRTQSAPEVLLSLRAAANSFEGKDTVSSLPYPVRMGIDRAYEADGGNLLVSGWLYDPDDHVAAVRLRRRDAGARLDERWTRLDRLDVTDSFDEQQDLAPGFQGGTHAHGFIAHAQLPGGDPDTPLYFELTLRDSRRAFLPVKPTKVSARVAALRQIGSFDPTTYALPSIVDAQIVPFLSESGKSAPVIDAIQDVGPFDQENGPPIIIGAGESEEDISPLLALLALDPETRHVPIVVAMPADRFSRHAARLSELARFYRLSVRLVAAKGTGDVYDLLEAGTEALSCETVVLLSASLIPHGTGWYGKLVSTAATLKGSIVSPVLAYEDHSVRWAGSWVNDAHDDQPIVGRYAGYPLKAVTAMKLTRIAAASLECCILPRDALSRGGGFSSGYLGSQEKGLDLGLRLSKAGIDSYLLPSVHMWGCDETPCPDTPAIAALVKEIDGKIFKARWRPTLTLEKHSQEGSA
ncbi:hypothetical protein [Sinorhizobium sp. BG8]|uniref:glycosyltransferase family 2 protein n=1 Tax=Sinorhizobium sp. BG8 TaxID=2613773 RepID=UPI001AF51234|nr:hypothetical protein [Sinorhizobium sp. BG8]QRM53304.1 hypothetical protein F3Y30_01000 [Sinorhizobium sp. BG8]